jgi:hypothetical protein
MGLGARGRERPPDDTGTSAIPGLAWDSCRPELVTRSRSSSLVAAGASATSTSALAARRGRGYGVFQVPGLCTAWTMSRIAATTS